MKWTACVLGIVVLVAGCGPAPSAPPPGDAGAGGSAAPSQAAAAPLQYKIAVVPKGLVHQFWLTVKAGAEAAGQESGAKIVWNGPPQETDVAAQISIIEDMLSSGVNALVMAACHETALIDVIKRATDKGVPVVTIDSGVKSDLPASFVATDNIAGARAAAAALARLIGEEGEVGVIPFVAGAATSEMREQGFKEALAAFPNVKLVATLYSDSDATKGMAVTQDMMTAHPALKGIFAANEAGAIGACQAIKAAGKAGAIKVVAFDASEDEIKSLKEGVVQALIVQNPFRMGYDGVKAAVDKLQGKSVEKRVDTGVTVVTLENFDTPEVQKLLYPLGKGE